MTHEEIVQILMGSVGTLGFAVLFNIKGKRMAAVVMSFYAELLARLMKTPTTTFLTTTLVPLIPGGSLYYTMAYAFSGQMESFLQKAIDTLQLASALALGIIVATMVTKVISELPVGQQKETNA